MVTRNDELIAQVTQSPPTRSRRGLPKDTVALQLDPLLRGYFADGLPVQMVFWDNSTLGPRDSPGSVIVRSPNVLRRLAWSPNELGLVRAYVAGEIGFEGDTFETLKLLHEAVSGGIRLSVSNLLQTASAMIRYGVFGGPLPRPPEELRPRGAVHSTARDARAISHHYDVGNDFYRLVLGPSLTYSCARFARGDDTLEAAQEAKHELICRKLGLDERPGSRLLDVGCGWGSMALHAATRYGAEVVGITLSREQATAAKARVADAGLTDRVEIRFQDYRDLGGETFGAISSIGMFEHVGKQRMQQYFATLSGLLEPEGRLLNHAISTPGGSKLKRAGFVNRYIFPDGELIDVAVVAQSMEDTGFELRDIESLREHYSTTLHRWVANLEEHWQRAVELVGEARARVWWLYLSTSANGFDTGGLAIHQVLGVKPGPKGESAMPRTRDAW